MRAERLLVASLMMCPERIPDCYGIIEPEMLQDNFSRSAYKAILTLYDTGSDIVMPRVEQMIDIDSYEGMFTDNIRPYLLEATGYGVKGYAETIVTDYKARMLERITKDIKPNKADIDGQISDTILQLEALRTRNEIGIRSLSDIVNEVQDDYFVDREGTRLSTGFNQLDDILGGLERGDILVIGARPAVGKSALATQITLNLATEGKRVGFYNLEMSGRQVYERLLSGISRIPLQRIRSAISFLNDEREKVQKANAILKELPLRIRNGSVSVRQIRNECRHLDLDVIIVDYLQLMKSDTNYGNRTADVGAISKSLKALAMELKIPIIALSQLNRQSEYMAGEPTIAQLRESGDIEQDASVVLLLWALQDGTRKLKVAKNRQGRLGTIELDFDGEHMRFSERTKDGFNDPEGMTPFD